MVKLLHSNGATVNAFDKKDRRALHWASYMGHVEVVEELHQYGAELNCRDKQVKGRGWTKVESMTRSQMIGR